MSDSRWAGVGYTEGRKQNFLAVHIRKGGQRRGLGGAPQAGQHFFTEYTWQRGREMNVPGGSGSGLQCSAPRAAPAAPVPCRLCSFGGAFAGHIPVALPLSPLRFGRFTRNANPSSD